MHRTGTVVNCGRDGLTHDTILINDTRRFGPPELQGKCHSGAISHHEGFVAGWAECGRAETGIVSGRAHGEHAVLHREFTVVEVPPLAEARVKVPDGDHIRFKLLESFLPQRIIGLQFYELFIEAARFIGLSFSLRSCARYSPRK